MPSTSIIAIDYDAASKELRVTFASGRTFVHRSVPSAIYAAFTAADEPSTFYNEQIRDRFPRA